MDVDNLLAENAALKRKLQSKSEALLILNQELNKYIDENNHLKKWPENYINQGSPYYQLSKFRLSDCSNCKQIANIKKEKNSLLLENEELKLQLNNAYGDIKVLRQEKKGNCETGSGNWHGREALVSSLEVATEKIKQLENDLATLLDEKHELVAERDLYRCKLHRLNHQLCNVLQAPNMDIDSLILENKCLHDRLEQAYVDKELLQHNLSKYKTMLDKKRNKGAVQIGTVSSCEGMVVTHKQVQELLDSHMNNTEATLADLRSLCLAMLESLQDKSLALAHHKKTSKLLANRISDLETMLTKGSDTVLYPCKFIMNGYSSSQVDKDLCKISSNDICDKYVENKITENGSVNSVHQVENEDNLPPDLQELVFRAIQDINKKDSNMH